MKKLTFFDATLLQGGAERVISILTREMASSVEDLKIEIVLWYAAPVFYEIDPAVNVILIPQAAGSEQFLKKLLWLHRYLKNETDVMVSFLAPVNMIAITAHFFTGKPLIVADRNDPGRVPVKIAVRKMRDFLYRFADGIVLQTKKNQEYFHRVIRRKSTVIYNPVNLGDYAGAALDVEKTSKIVSVGRLTPQKNQKMLLRAFAEVLEKFPQYRLEIYGEESPFKAELEELAEQLGIRHNVLFAGSVSDLHDRIKDAELFVLSSDYEGMPNALIEAMCMGLPVISTKVSGATDLIEDHENGLLVGVNDQKALQTAMLEVLSDQKLGRKIAENAVRLNDRLEISKITQQWIHFIREKSIGK